MKKLTALILAFIMIFSTLPVVFAADSYKCSCDTTPIIYVKGRTNIYKDRYDELNDENMAETNITGDTGSLVETAANIVSSLGVALLTDKWDNYCDVLFEEIRPIYDQYKLNNDGEKDEGSKTGIDPNWDVDNIIKNLKTDGVRHGHTSNGLNWPQYMQFQYDMRLDPCVNAKDLKKLIDAVKEETGHNVAGFKKPTGEVKRRIIFNGHPDAAWEWPFKYKFTYLGFDIHMLVCFAGAVYVLVTAILKIAGVFSASTAMKVGLIGLVFAPFWFGLYFMWNKKRVVDGANDNLSGCYIGMAILKFLKDEGIELENTEIGVVLTGSEEAGLRGAKAWAEAHKDEMSDVPTFVYSYDTIAQSEQLMVNYRDLNSTVKVDKDVSDLFYEACQELGIPCKKGMVPPLGGATDSAAFAQAGMRATGITALNHALPDFYHTRLDTPDALNKDCLEKCFAASVKVLEMFDNGAKQ